MDLSDVSAPGPDDPSATAAAPGSADGERNPGAGETRLARRRLTILLWGVAGVVLLLDQVSKAVVVRTLVEGERTDLLGNLLGLQLLYNPGAAFSMGSGYTVVFTVIMVAVIAVVVRSARTLGSRGWAWALGLLVGGAAGNLVDRVVRAPGPGRGEVVDFIAYADWFIGNVADIAIVAAAAGIVVMSLLGIALDGGRDGDQARTPRDTAPRDTAPRDTAPRDTAPRDTAPRDTAPRDTAPRDTATDSATAEGTGA